MSRRQSIVAFVGAIAVALGFAAPSLAQTTDTVTVTLGGGVITFSIDVTANISSLSYNHETGYSNGSGGAFTVAVKDDRNTAAGYVISLAASNFTRVGGGTGNIILGSTGTLSVPTAGTVTRDSGDPVNLPTANTAASLSSTAVPILSAASGVGNGHYTASGYALALSNVSASVPNGTYSSTLTVSSTAGP